MTSPHCRFVLAASLGAILSMGPGAVRQTAGATVTITMTADDTYALYVNGAYLGTGTHWESPEVWTAEVPPGPVTIAVHAFDDVPYLNSAVGLIAIVSTPGSPEIVTDGFWRVSPAGPVGWQAAAFDDSAWPAAFIEGAYDALPWSRFASPIPAFGAAGAKWIWRSGLPYSPGYGYYNPGTHTVCYLRRTFVPDLATPVHGASWGQIKSAWR